MTTNHECSGSTPDGGAKHSWTPTSIFRWECRECGKGWIIMEDPEPEFCAASVLRRNMISF